MAPEIKTVWFVSYEWESADGKVGAVIAKLFPRLAEAEEHLRDAEQEHDLHNVTVWEGTVCEWDAHNWVPASSGYIRNL